ncbi:hypothetical protein [Mucilaginibacter sp. KACC 22063]|uniref:hypothetical protein n=1 Tax=Mucilaginibacter sp. KACC 22063 TaxID=3025666 RepID=UPI002366D4E4|nr:hypothetical protein [Mucilaginibacter sp. KACC 22063]WDF54009.1 hypothetical protein PQ461_13765 [Mucilaginibacter sp. KACC 22063]
MKSQTVVYSNDFETSDLKNITNGVIEIFHGTHVLGRYNNGSFVLNVPNLPKHDLIKVSFDLYIHDSWDGSQSFADNLLGPDMWQMIADGKTYINTTFSNSICQPGNICPSQAYPGNYPSNNNPRTGAENVNLPGACLNASDPRGTSLYHITKTIDHTSSSFSLICLDHLIDKNVADPKCSESWSVDNITISTIAL